MPESYEHHQEYISVIKKYLKKNNITDYTKFEVALSHDKPLFLKWEYTSNIEKPTEEYLLKEFKIDLSEPRKSQRLELKYIYINNPKIFKQATKHGSIDSNKLKQPIYYNIDGEIGDPSSIDTRELNQF